MIILLSLLTIQNSLGQIYSADFSNDGDGFPDHTTGTPPATGPITTVNFGTLPNQWFLSYDTAPATDGSGNLFKVRTNKLETTDWGGEATFKSQNIDISGETSINITATGVTLGSSVQNVAAEFFKYFYILDGGTPVETDIPLSGDTSGTAVNFSITGLDVSAANTLVVGFSFNCNGSGDGYSISEFKVETAGSNPAPQITNISNTPSTPNSSQTVSVTADITDADGIASANVKWGTASGSLTNTVSMSNTSGNTYAGTIPTQANGTTIYYAVEATDSNASPETTTSSESNYTVTDPIPSTLPYTIDITSNNPELNNWAYQSVSGSETWSWTNGTGVAMNGYNSSCKANEDWLVSPSFNLSGTSNEVLSFNLRQRFGTDKLEVLYSTNYSGDASTATWVNITTLNAESATPTYANISKSIALNSLSASSVHFAFKYVSGTADCSYWEVQNFSLKQGVTWSGASSNDWSTASNWSSGSVPTTTDDVIIPSGLTNYPTVSSAITVNSITLNSGTSIIANASITGNLTYNRTLTTNWHLVSVPVEGETIQDLISNYSFATGTGSNIGIAPYDNAQASGSRWTYQTSASAGNLNNAQGYSIKLSSAGTLSFTGRVNNTTTNITMVKNTNAFNLVGNPFASYVNSGTLLTDNTAKLESETIWLWNGTAYETKVSSDNFALAPGQGFFVEAKNGSEDLTFNTSYQSHNSTDTFQRSSSKSEIELIVSNGKENSKTKFYFIEGTTKGFDNGYDGKVFTGISNDFSVYSELVNDNKGINYAIQALPKSEIDGLIIPLGLDATASKNIEFSIDTKNIPEDIFIYLEDRVNKTITNLSETTYKTSIKGNSNGIGQFYVHTTSKKLDNLTDLSIADLSIYKSAPNTLTIVGLQAEASLKIFSILGKELVRKEINSNGVSNIDIPYLTAGAYIVEITSEKGKTSKKIILD